MYETNPNHRAIVITEGGATIFRHDNNSNKTQNLETDLVQALIRLKQDKRIDIDRFMLILKANENKFGFEDALDILLDYASGDGKFKNIHENTKV